MTVTVTQHALERYRERFPGHARWWDGEIAARLRWLAYRAVEVGNCPGGGRFVRSRGVVMVVRGRCILTVLRDGWCLRNNHGRHAPRRPKGLKPVPGGRLSRAGRGGT